MNNDEMIKIFQQWNLHDNSKTYPVFFNSYRWLSILAECFTSVMHHTSIIIWRKKWVNCRSPVLVKIFLCSWKGKSSTGTKNGVHSHCVKKRLNKERKIDVAITWKLSKSMLTWASVFILYFDVRVSIRPRLFMIKSNCMPWKKQHFIDQKPYNRYC